MQTTITINYWWKCSKFKTVPESLVETLNESAIDRIAEQMKDGIVEGELCTYVYENVPGKKTPEEGWECSGGFSIDSSSS